MSHYGILKAINPRSNGEVIVVEPILISGAGPVGLSLALALTSRGIPVVVLERRPIAGWEFRATTFHPPTLEMFHRWGILGRLDELGCRTRVLQYWDRSRRALIAEFDYNQLSDVTDFPFCLQCSQHLVVRELYDALQKSGLADVRLGTEIVDFNNDGGVEVIVESHGQSAAIKGAVLCAADGRDSFVRRRLEIAFEGEVYAEPLLLIGTTIEMGDFFRGMKDVSHIIDTHQWVIVTALGNETRMIFGLEPGANPVQAQTNEAIKMRVAALLGREADYCIQHRAVHTVHRKIATRFAEKYVALLGDAAHLLSPVLGSGLNCGIHDADAYADAIVSFTKGSGDITALHSAAERRREKTAHQVQNRAHAEYLRLSEIKLNEPSITDIARTPALARKHLLRTSLMADRG